MNINWNPLFTPFKIDRYTTKDIITGIAITGLAMVVIFLISLLAGFIQVKEVSFDASTFFYYTGLTLIASGYEELLYRLILLSLLIKLLKRPWIALVLTSIVFGVLHAGNDHATVISVLSNGLGGLMYGLAFVGTRTIWFPWALHFAWNYLQATLLGFPMSGFNVEGIIKLNLLDESWISGGLYGPEGGIVGISIRLVVILMIYLWIKNSRGRIGLHSNSVVLNN